MNNLWHRSWIGDCRGGVSVRDLWASQFVRRLKRRCWPA